MKKSIILFSILLTFVLAACGGETSAAGSAAVAAGAVAQAVSTAAQPGALNDTYRDALPVAQQLALGTLSLESTDLAITAEQAAALLPLWQVVQSLDTTGNVADVEMTAVLKQLQGAMDSEQVAAIAAMQLTADKVQEMVDNGTLTLGRGAGARDGAAAGQGGGAGRGAGGGFPGGGPGGAGGGPGGELGSIDPGVIETRQAELAASGENPLSALLAQGSAGMVVRLLQTKTGQAPAFGGGLMEAAITAVSETTGLNAEEISAALAEGTSLRELITANGGDETAVREALTAALADTTLPPDRDLETFIEDLLSGG